MDELQLFRLFCGERAAERLAVVCATAFGRGDGTVLPHVFDDSHMPVGQVGIVLSATETNHVADAGRKSPFSCSHDHDHAGEWCRFTGLTIHLIFQTSGQKPDFRTVQDMVLEPAGVSACGNQ